MRITGDIYLTKVGSKTISHELAQKKKTEIEEVNLVFCAVSGGGRPIPTNKNRIKVRFQS